MYYFKIYGAAAKVHLIQETMTSNPKYKAASLGYVMGLSILIVGLISALFLCVYWIEKMNAEGLMKITQIKRHRNQIHAYLQETSSEFDETNLHIEHYLHGILPVLVAESQNLKSALFVGKKPLHKNTSIYMSNNGTTLYVRDLSQLLGDLWIPSGGIRKK